MQTHNSVKNTSSAPKITDALQSMVPGQNFTSTLSRNEIYSIVSHLSKFFQHYTAKYRLDSAIKKLELVAHEFEIKLSDTSKLSLDDKFMKIKEETEPKLFEVLQIMHFDFTNFPKFIIELLKPLYLKNLLATPIKYYLEKFSLRLANNALERLMDGRIANKDVSILEFLDRGADINAFIYNNEQPASSFFSQILMLYVNHWRGPLALEEVLSHPELKLDPNNVNFRDLPTTTTLAYLQALMLKGMSVSTAFSYTKNVYVFNPHDVDFTQKYLEFFLPLLNDGDFAQSYFSIFNNNLGARSDLQNFYAANFSSMAKYLSVSRVIIKTLERLIELGVSKSLILGLFTVRSRLGDEHYNFIETLIVNQPIEVNELFLGLIASLAKPENYDTLFKLFTTEDSNNFLTRAGTTSGYIDFLYTKGYISTLKKLFNSLPIELSEHLTHETISFYPNYFQLQIKESNDIPYQIVLAELGSIFKSKCIELDPNSALILTSLFAMLGINQFITSTGMSYLLSDTYFYFDITINKSILNNFVKEINTQYKESALIIDHNLESKDSIESLDPDANKNNFILMIRNSLFINPLFLESLNESYKKVLFSSDQLLQKYVDDAFKKQKLYPDVDSLTLQYNQLEKLINELDKSIPSSINIPETLKLLSNIKLFIDQLGKYPHPADFPSLTKQVYESTSMAKLITQFGVIQPQRTLFEPIHDAAEQLNYRYL